MKYKKISIYILILCFIIVNIISIFHSYKFTHFQTENLSNRTSSPNELNFLEKIKIMAFGVNNPKPKFEGKIPKGYELKKIQSNVELEIWEKDIPNSKGFVLLFHGYSAEKSSLIKNANYFNELGFSTILIDFMGCGNSEGNTSTIGYFEAENVLAVYKYALKKSQNIILYGHSMGSASIMRAISKFQINPQKIIIECPFGSMQQTVENRFKNMNVPTFPLSYFLTFWGGTINGFWAFKHNPENYAKKITQPVLLMYGVKDKNVKRFEVDNIFNNINSKNKFLKTFALAGHENYIINHSAEWKNAVSTFINSDYK